MTEQEIRALYAVAMAYDNRKPSEANIAAWREQAHRNRWTLHEASEAIHTHHSQSTEYLTPAHITAILRADRRQPAPVEAVAALPAAPPAKPERINAIMAALTRRLGWRRQSTDQNTAALTVECPFCHAQPRRPCTRQVGRGAQRGQYVPLASVHPSRAEAAHKAQQPPAA